MSDWARVARRMRVPLGFALAAVYFLLANPTWVSMVVGSALVAPGLGLRAIASGHVQKDRVLSTSGPYAYTRNPLYLGSLIMAAGFAVAGRSVVIASLIALLFLLIYLPVIRSEEEHLRGAFIEFEEYARHVPRLLPRFRAARFRSGDGGASGERALFSRQLYVQHREYNAGLGALLMMVALALKLLWLQGRI